MKGETVPKKADLIKNDNRNRFDSLIGTLRQPPEEGLPVSLYDDLTAVYTEMDDAANARIEEMQEQIKGYESEISRLKARNYDLLMMSPGSMNQPQDNSPDSASDSNDNKGIDSLFGKDDK